MRRAPRGRIPHGASSYEPYGLETVRTNGLAPRIGASERAARCLLCSLAEPSEMGSRQGAGPSRQRPEIRMGAGYRRRARPNAGRVVPTRGRFPGASHAGPWPCWGSRPAAALAILSTSSRTRSSACCRRALSFHKTIPPVGRQPDLSTLNFDEFPGLQAPQPTPESLTHPA